MAFRKQQWRPVSRSQRWRPLQTEDRRKGIVTLYVANIPTTLHWSRLRQTFERHGDVVDSFIARKQNKAGKRFGFVRFSNRNGAERAIERLNGFKLYGSRLLVSVARFKARTSYWRKSINDTKHQKEKERTNSSTQFDFKKKSVDPVEDSDSRDTKTLELKDMCKRKIYQS
ncbi:hypothetical protein V6N13_071838 [Hibiscus sabdariffa]